MRENREYSFESFRRNEGNEEAFQIMKKAAGYNLTAVPNPIWLTGKSGTGKTHLLYALKRELEQKEQKKTTRIVSCHDLMRELIAVFSWDVYEDAIQDYVERFCREDVIMIEDVDYCLRGREASQVELVRLIRILVEKYEKQVVLTAYEEFVPFADWLKRKMQTGIVVQLKK